MIYIKRAKQNYIEIGYNRLRNIGIIVNYTRFQPIHEINIKIHHLIYKKKHQKFKVLWGKKARNFEGQTDDILAFTFA